MLSTSISATSRFAHTALSFLNRSIVGPERVAWSDLCAAALRPELGLALRLCVPALTVAALLRLGVLWHMPFAFFISDTRNFISQAELTIEENRLVSGTRTFLMPLLYSFPLRWDEPVLAWAAAGQHALGLLMVLAGGLLCFAWMPHWRWWIVPFTLLLAIHPSLLWYEHMALPESTYVTFMLVTACLVALFYNFPCAPAYLGLLAAIALAAGARQEGFLLNAAALGAVVLRFWRHVPRLLVYCTVTVLAAKGITESSKTSQGGQMLITSLIHWMPDDLRCDPEFAQLAAPLRDELRPLWPAFPDQHNKTRKRIVALVETHLQQSRGMTLKEARRAKDDFCKEVGIEIALRNWWRLPGMVYNKFLATHREPPTMVTGTFGAEWAHGEHFNYMFGAENMKERKFMERFYGRDYPTPEAFREALETELYRPIPWLSAWQRAFNDFTVLPHWRKVGPVDGFQQNLPRMPWIYIAAIVGLVACAARQSPQPHVLWVWLVTLLFSLCVVLTVGSLRSRYRLAFEPYVWLGLFALADTVWIVVRAAAARAFAARLNPASDAAAPSTR